MIEKRTILDQIEITRGGILQIRFGLLLVEDGKEIDCKWHRTSVEPGGSVDAQIAAVNEDLTARGNKPVDQAAVAKLKAIIAAAHSA
jgi:hypothetical protein